MSNLPALKQLINSDGAQRKLQELVGKNAPAFATSVMQIANSNDMLAKADPHTVFSAAVMAAVMNLPISNQLGMAYIVPFNTKKKDANGKEYWVTEAQFQIGYKGWIQLALRSGQVKRISATPIYAGQLVKADPLRGYEYDFTVEAKGQPIGYAAYLELLNGCEAELYMTRKQAEGHAGRYSETFKKGFGVWKNNFDAMALKTVLKSLISKYAPKSVEMQQALQADQAVIRDVDNQEFDHIDNKQDDPLVIEAQGKSAADAALDALSAQENEYATMRG